MGSQSGWSWLVAAAAASLVSGSAAAGKVMRPTRAALTCASTTLNDQRVVLSGKPGAGWRIERPVRCLVTLTAPVDGLVYQAVVYTTYETVDETTGKLVTVKSTTRSGPVSYWHDAITGFAATFAPDDGSPGGGDFTPCLDFTVHASLTGSEARSWTAKLVVEQSCPD